MSTIHEIMPISIPKTKRPIQKKGCFPCQDCSKTFQLKHNLNRHIKIHGGPEIKVKCHQCCKELKNLNEHERHLREIHGQIECPRCHFRCKKTEELKSHEFCLHCDKDGCTFVSQSETKFKLHQYKCLGFMKCDLCFRRFETNRLFPYKRHMNEAHKVKI